VLDPAARSASRQLLHVHCAGRFVSTQFQAFQLAFLTMLHSGFMFPCEGTPRAATLPEMLPQVAKVCASFLVMMGVAIARFAAEAPWYPTALLPGPGVSRYAFHDWVRKRLDLPMMGRCRLARYPEAGPR